MLPWGNSFVLSGETTEGQSSLGHLFYWGFFQLNKHLENDYEEQGTLLGTMMNTNASKKEADMSENTWHQTK